MSFSLGIDIGSTTVKIVLADQNKKIYYKSYRRHFANLVKVLAEQLTDIKNILGAQKVRVAITGSGGMELAQKSQLCYVQEVFATSSFVPAMLGSVDTVIELGGEDAKIIFFDTNIDERMNGTCAGGTGAFIDQMAMLLGVSVDELDSLSLQATAIYPIASRCGVFAKSDIQPLLNQGASKENIAASVYAAVVDQTIGGLAGGRPIEGKVLFLGGPLTFCRGLRNAFLKTLKNIEPVFLENSQYVVCFAAAFYAFQNAEELPLDVVFSRMKEATKMMLSSSDRCTPLFADIYAYSEFCARHNKEDIRYDRLLENSSTAFIGIDAGSTTTKMVAINQNHEIIFSAYTSNNGSPVETVKTQLLNFYAQCKNISIGGSIVTGYGEDLICHAFGVDKGVVETVAHYTAAKFFEPDVDFIIDIGGQDMKCFGIKNKTIDSVVLNEACSSGCGSFLQAFSQSMGYNIESFAKIALFAKNPVDLGSRCTVFMNSAVKQAQKSGASVEDIVAGLAISVVKNALFKVLRVSDPKQLGEKIVVQGGTFRNDAVLRAFEQALGTQVTRPSISELMGAFGAALIAKESNQSQKSMLISHEKLLLFSSSSQYTHCSLCQNKCSLTINQFSDGNKFISGNRCQRPLGIPLENKLPNLYEYKQDYLAQLIHQSDFSKPIIGIPLVLHFYDTLPFWVALFEELGFSIKISGPSSRKLYRKGQHTIASDTICYGAKLVHGHVLQLMEDNVDAIFYPRMSYNYKEGNSNNHYHCPVVAYYPEVIGANLHPEKSTSFLTNYLDLNSEKKLATQLFAMLTPLNPNISKKSIVKAIKVGKIAQKTYRKSVLSEGTRAMDYAKEHNKKVVVLAGRPYHIDPEINHGIDKILSAMEIVVLSEDSLESKEYEPVRGVLNQWTYHSRMYHAAQCVTTMQNTELVQLISFGCGLDAITSDEILDILSAKRKLYTCLKIDEINNLGAAKIRLRSLLAAMEEMDKKNENIYK